MFKQLAVAATIIASAFLPSAVQAYSVGNECGSILGYQTCVNYQDADSPDVIMVDGPNGTSRIYASCYADGGYDWNATGPNSKMFINMLVDAYCDI